MLAQAMVVDPESAPTALNFAPDTERKLSASGAKFSAVGTLSGSMTMACASIK